MLHLPYAQQPHEEQRPQCCGWRNHCMKRLLLVSFQHALGPPRSLALRSQRHDQRAQILPRAQRPKRARLQVDLQINLKVRVTQGR